MMFKVMTTMIAISTFSLLHTNAQASTPAFTALTQNQFDNIMRDFSASSSWHSATPASSMGSVFGLEVGVLAGTTNTPGFNAASPGADVKMIPHANLLGVISVPFGITAEVLFLPKLELSGLSYQRFGGALKWSPSLSILPANVAIRGFMTKSELSFEQTTPISATIKQESTVTGIQLLASPKLIPIVEPYIGIGYAMASGKMTDSSGALFQFTPAQTAESKPTSTQILIGADIRLLVLGLGFEYERSFDTESMTAKLSLKF